MDFTKKLKIVFEQPKKVLSSQFVLLLFHFFYEKENQYLSTCQRIARGYGVCAGNANQ
ncbi:hypothetical protein AGMMS4956_13210 [Bacteroidia bacterium]|nr:hypothetical protein AGMMS4956_13210 [Bacteroidia bacterium]